MLLFLSVEMWKHQLQPPLRRPLLALLLLHLLFLLFLHRTLHFLKKESLQRSGIWAARFKIRSNTLTQEQ